MPSTPRTLALVPLEGKEERLDTLTRELWGSMPLLVRGAISVGW